MRRLHLHRGGGSALGKLEAGAWFVIAALSLAVIAHPVIADDQWWHILTGRLILARHAIPDTDPFSFTYGGKPWTNWEWLFGVIAAFGWDRWGVSWLYFLRVLTTGVCVLSTVGNIGRRPATPAPGLTLLLIALMLLCLEYRVGDRPHTFGFALLAFCFCLGDELALRPDWRRAAGLFGLLVAWVGLHPSFGLGLVVVGCLHVDAIVDDVLALGTGGALSRNARRAGQAAVLMLSALCTHHLGAHFDALGTTFADPVSSEWSSLASHLGHHHPWLYAFFALALGWLAALLADARQRRSTLSAVVAALLVGSFVYSRFVVEFAIVAVVMIHRGLATRWERLATRSPLRPTLLQVLGLLVAFFAVKVETEHSYGGLAFGLDLQANPVTQTEFMRRHAMRGRVFGTTRGANGYVSLQLWPRVLTFIDGRVPQLFPLWLAELHAGATKPEVFADLVTRYDFDHVVVTRGTFEHDGVLWGRLLQQHGGFALVYFDGHGMVFTRVREHGLGCRDCEALTLQPWRMNDAWIKTELRKQPFEPMLHELSYALRVSSGAPIIRSLIHTLSDEAPLEASQRARLRALAQAPLASDAQGPGNRSAR